MLFLLLFVAIYVRVDLVDILVISDILVVFVVNDIIFEGL